MPTIAIAEEYIRIKPKSKVLVITKNKLGSINFRKDIPKCSTQFGEHSSSETVSIEDDDDDSISQVSTEEKRRKKEERVTFGSIGKKYQFTTHITFANKELTEEKMSESIDKYKDSLIIIDEVHHIREAGDESTTYERYMKFLDKLMEYPTKIIIMTGTPMRDNEKEIINLINLILLKKIPSNFENFSIYKK